MTTNTESITKDIALKPNYYNCNSNTQYFVTPTKDTTTRWDSARITKAKLDSCQQSNVNGLKNRGDVVILGSNTERRGYAPPPPLAVITSDDALGNYYFSPDGVCTTGCLNMSCSNSCASNDLVQVTLINCTNSDLILCITLNDSSVVNTNLPIPNGASIDVWIVPVLTVSFIGTNAPSDSFNITTTSGYGTSDGNLYISSSSISWTATTCDVLNSQTIDETVPFPDSSFRKLWWVWVLIIVGVIIFIVIFIFIFKLIKK